MKRWIAPEVLIPLGLALCGLIYWKAQVDFSLKALQAYTEGLDKRVNRLERRHREVEDPR